MCSLRFTVFSADNRTKPHFSSGCSYQQTRCVRQIFTHQAPVSPSFPTTNIASKLLSPPKNLELSPRRAMCWNTGRSPSKRVHETGFQVSHEKGDPPHTFEWSTLQVQENNKHVALLMFMELEPRGAPIGRNRRKISQSKGSLHFRETPAHLFSIFREHRLF